MHEDRMRTGLGDAPAWVMFKAAHGSSHAVTALAWVGMRACCLHRVHSPALPDTHDFGIPFKKV